MTERNSCVLRLSLDSNALSRVGQAFDDLWAAIAAHYTESEVEDARTRLATIILGLAADGLGIWNRLKQLRWTSLALTALRRTFFIEAGFDLAKLRQQFLHLSGQFPVVLQS